MSKGVELDLLGHIATVGNAGAVVVEVLAVQTLIRSSAPAAILVALIRAYLTSFT